MNHGGAVCLPTRVNLYAVLMRCHRLLYLVQKGRQCINIERKRPITDNIDALCELLIDTTLKFMYSEMVPSVPIIESFYFL